jgi:hypothetical protein
MPAYQRDRSVEERLAIVEDQLAALRRQGSLVDDLAMFPVYFEAAVFDDSTALDPTWSNTFTPRASTLTLGLLFFGDTVGTTNTGGAWDVTLNGASVANGTVPATYTIVTPTVILDLSPYLGTKDLTVAVRTRRTSGATTGGRYTTGGCIASGVTFARLS